MVAPVETIDASLQQFLEDVRGLQAEMGPDYPLISTTTAPLTDVGEGRATLESSARATQLFDTLIQIGRARQTGHVAIGGTFHPSYELVG